MTRKFFRGELTLSTPYTTVRLGAQNAPYKDTELRKFVKPGTLDSQYVLCAVGDPIDGYITAVEAATSDGFGIGSIQRRDPKYVVFEGSQAAGTGAIAIGDFVVAGTPVAKDTDGVAAHPKVRKATVQLGAVPADLTAAGAQVLASLYAWKVVSLGPVGTGAVGTVGLIERIGGPAQ